MSSTTLVTVGRRQYVSGLYWENSPSGRVAQAAREAARQPATHAKFFAVRSGNKNGRIPQFGLTQEEGDQIRSSIPVLAGSLANQQPGSWVGAFRLQEGISVVVVRDDLIVPDGDLFYKDETEARDRLLQEMALGGLQRVYAPETWGVPGADSLPITLLLNDKADVVLRAVAMSKQTRTALLIGGALLALCLVGGYVYQEELARREQEENERLQALDRIKAQLQNATLPGMTKPVEYPPPERVWEKSPRPLDYLAACQEAFEKAPLTHAGWRLDTVRCDETSLVQSWSRVGGFSNPPPGSIITDDASTATSSLPLRHLPVRGGESLVDPQVVTERYLVQNWPGGIARMADDPPPPPPPGYQGEWQPPPAPWVKRSFTMAAPSLPWLIPTYLADLPGVMITKLVMSVNGSQGSWSMDGVIYENRR